MDNKIEREEKKKIRRKRKIRGGQREETRRVRSWVGGKTHPSTGPAPPRNLA